MTGPKTMTDRQLAANRRNAQRSTGPRTAAGKAVSRWNALKHGVLAQAIIPPALEPHESRAAFDQLLETLRQELAPATALEELLVERIATSYWRLGRVLRAESGEVAERLASAEEHLEGHGSLDRLLANSFAAAPSPDERLAQRIAAFTEAGSNAARLRRLLAADDERWRSASDDEVRAAAAQELATLQEQRAQNRRQELDLILARCSIPSPVNMAVMARYESMLERQIYQALQALERLQRMRGGEFVAPPLVVAVSPPDGDGG